MGWVVAKAEAKKQVNTGQYSTTRPKQTCVDSGSSIRSPLLNWSPPFVQFHQLLIYMIRKKHSEETDQLTLASGGSEHA